MKESVAFIQTFEIVQNYRLKRYCTENNNRRSMIRLLLRECFRCV
jgi:hypothetical protein